MKTKAAILAETGKPLTLTEIDIPQLKSGQVLVEIAYTGVCHTQILEARGHRGEDKYLPHCLGHEGSGIVKEIGPEVKKVRPGDKVVLTWMKGSGANAPGTVYKLNGNNVNSGAITTFSSQSVISENRLVPIPKDSKLSLKEASMIGCALPTGLGAVLNVAKPEKGSSIAVFGLGGVGLSAIAGAKIAGCKQIIAVDVMDSKLELAKKFGATHTVNASKSNPLDFIMEIINGILDFAVECSGTVKAMETCLLAVRNQGGKAVIVGNAHFGKKLEVDPFQFNLGKSILGTWGGDNNPDEDFLKYIKFVEEGKIDLYPFVSKTYRLEDINEAMDDLERGRVLRPLIDMKIGQ